MVAILATAITDTLDIVTFPIAADCPILPPNVTSLKKLCLSNSGNYTSKEHL